MPCFVYSNLITRLIDILRTEVDSEKDRNDGKVLLMYEWRTFLLKYSIDLSYNVFPVSKVTLDIICETAFGYQTDSLHNPDNELAEAYHKLTSLQTGNSYPSSFRMVPRIPPRTKYGSFHCRPLDARCHENVPFRMGLQPSSLVRQVRSHS